MDFVNFSLVDLRPLQQILLWGMVILLIVGVVMLAIGQHELGIVCAGLFVGCLLTLLGEKIWHIRKEDAAIRQNQETFDKIF